MINFSVNKNEYLSDSNRLVGAANLNALFPNSVQMFGIDKMNESWDLRQ